MATNVLPIPYDKLAAYCQQNQIEYLALFGSAVRDELRPDSGIRRELGQLFQRPVDLVSRSGLKPLIRNDVLESERVLFVE